MKMMELLGSSMAASGLTYLLIFNGQNQFCCDYGCCFCNLEHRSRGKTLKAHNSFKSKLSFLEKQNKNYLKLVVTLKLSDVIYCVTIFVRKKSY